MICWGYPGETLSSVKNNFSEITKKTYTQFNDEMLAWKQEYKDETAAVKKMIMKVNPIILPAKVYVKVSPDGS